MTKYEWERQLKKGISGLPKSEQQRVLDYYNELFADKIDAGLREQYIISEFGNPYDVANKILLDYYNEGKENPEVDEYIYSSSDDIDEAFDEPTPTVVEAPRRKTREEHKASRHNDDDDIVVEVVDDKDGNGKKDKKVNKSVAGISGLVFLIAVFAYCFIGACFNKWHPTWLIFLLAPSVVSLIQAIARRNWRIFAYPVFVAFLFLLIGFTTHRWNPAWVLFVTIPLYYVLGGFIVKNTNGSKNDEKKEKKEKQNKRNQKVSTADYEEVYPTESTTTTNKSSKSKSKNNSTATDVITTIAKVLLAICLVFVAIAVWSFVINLFIGGIGMMIGGIACIVMSALNIIGGAVDMLLLGGALALLGLGLICTFGMAALFKPCFNMCKSFVNTIKSSFDGKEAE
ncbi:MAG: DUF1700 domain-containing protein [Clostridia bacterium]|nr:DUF1700 domain-containing protein [Clostridia bacterium]